MKKYYWKINGYLYEVSKEKRAIYDIIDKLPGKFVNFDDSVVKSMVTRVKILTQEKIEVTLFDAVTLTVNI